MGWRVSFFCGALLLLGCSSRGSSQGLDSVSRDSATRSLQGEVVSLRADFDSLNYTFLPSVITFAGESVPVHAWWVRKKLLETIRGYTGNQGSRERIQAYFIEAEEHFPYLDSALAEKHLPNDLKYLPILESGYNCAAQSYAGAVGCWQIMHGTAISLGLRNNRFVDERKDFVRATDAALKKLSDDYATLGSWFLALAAYDAGTGRVSGAVKRIDSDSYFDLVFWKKDGSFNQETMNYVYQVIALKIIFEHEKEYHFDNSPETKTRVMTFSFGDASKKRCDARSFIDVAQSLGLTPMEFHLLNPQFLRDKIPCGRYDIRVPKYSKKE